MVTSINIPDSVYATLRQASFARAIKRGNARPSMSAIVLEALTPHLAALEAEAAAATAQRVA